MSVWINILLLLASAWLLLRLCMKVNGGRKWPAAVVSVIYCVWPSVAYWIAEPTPDMARIAATVAIAWAIVEWLPLRKPWAKAGAVAIMVGWAWVMLPGAAERKFKLAGDMGLLMTEQTDNMSLRTGISRIYGEADVLVDNGSDLYLHIKRIPEGEDITETDIEAVADKALEGHGGDVGRHLMRRLQWIVRGLPMMYVPPTPAAQWVAKRFCPTFWIYLGALLVTGVWLVKRWRRGRRDKVAVTAWAMIMIVTGTGLLCLTDDWLRYMASTVPMLLLLAYFILRRWRFAPRKLL